MTHLSVQECANVFERAVRKRPLAMKVIPLQTFTPTSSPHDVGETWDHQVGVSFQAVAVQMACKATVDGTAVSISRVGPMLGAAALPLWNHVLRAFGAADIGIAAKSEPATVGQSASAAVGYSPPPPAPPAAAPPPPAPRAPSPAVSLPSEPPPPSTFGSATPSQIADAFIDYIQAVDLDIVPVDWDDLRARLLDFEGRAPDTNIDDASERSFFAVTIRAASGRTQTVMVSHIEGERGPDWFRVESGFGPYHPQIALAGVDYVSNPENWGVGVARMGDHLFLRWVGTVGMDSLNNVLTMIDGVAGMADRLEESLSQGGDSY